jgi:MinD superfamily P-loop ATPase
MVIAVASGKGGTGKTTVATNLAVTLARRGEQVAYFDCDVEEPNGHIFLKPAITSSASVGVPVPKVDASKCTGCGKCGEICRYSAIVCINKKVLTFPELCHGCGGCTLVCPEDAISEIPREVGVIEEGMADGVGFAHGLLRVGEAMSPPLIREVKRRIPAGGIAIVDAPPGTSCPVIEAVKGADFVLLVTEPTPFGLNDLELAVGMVRELQLPMGVVINRADIGDGRVKEYCARENIELLAEIRDDRRIAEAYSRGEMVVDAVPDLSGRFEKMFEQVVNING